MAERDPNMDAPMHSVQDESMGHDGEGMDMTVPPATDSAHHTQTQRMVPWGRPDPYPNFKA